MKSINSPINNLKSTAFSQLNHARSSSEWKNIQAQATSSAVNICQTICGADPKKRTLVAKLADTIQKSINNDANQINLESPIQILLSSDFDPEQAQQLLKNIIIMSAHQGTFSGVADSKINWLGKTNKTPAIADFIKKIGKLTQENTTQQLSAERVTNNLHLKAEFGADAEFEIAKNIYSHVMDSKKNIPGDVKNQAFDNMMKWQMNPGLSANIEEFPITDPSHKLIFACLLDPNKRKIIISELDNVNERIAQPVAQYAIGMISNNYAFAKKDNLPEHAQYFDSDSGSRKPEAHTTYLAKYKETLELIKSSDDIVNKGDGDKFKLTEKGTKLGLDDRVKDFETSFFQGAVVVREFDSYMKNDTITGDKNFYTFLNQPADSTTTLANLVNDKNFNPKNNMRTVNLVTAGIEQIVVVYNDNAKANQKSTIDVTKLDHKSIIQSLTNLAATKIELTIDRDAAVIHSRERSNYNMMVETTNGEKIPAKTLTTNKMENILKGRNEMAQNYLTAVVGTLIEHKMNQANNPKSSAAKEKVLQLLTEYYNKSGFTIRDEGIPTPEDLLHLASNTSSIFQKQIPDTFKIFLIKQPKLLATLLSASYH